MPGAGAAAGVTLSGGLFSAALLVSWLGSVVHILGADRPISAMSPRMFRVPVRGAKVVAATLSTLLFFMCVASFATNRSRPAAAAAMLLLLAAVRGVERAQWPGDLVVRLGKYPPAGACLFGWLCGWSVACGLGRPDADALGWHAACGVMGAAYFLSAFAKLRASGADWMRWEYHALLIRERSFRGPHWLRSLRRNISTSKVACSAVGRGGLAIELLAASFVFPVARPFVGVSVLSLLAGFALLFGYFEPEWMLLVCALTAVSWP